MSGSEGEEDAEARAARKVAKRAKKERKAEKAAEKAAAAASDEPAPSPEPPAAKPAKRPREAPLPPPLPRAAPAGNGAAKRPRPPNASGPAPPATGDDADGLELFIKYLPRDVTEDELASLFAPCGPLAKPPALLRDFATGAPKGCGWVTFATAEGAQRALRERQGHALRGRHLDLSVATCRKERPGLKGAPQAPGTHTPALLEEVLSTLTRPDPDGTYVDATFGRGGHTRAMLAALSPQGALHAFDMDPVAVAAGEALAGDDARFAIHAACFGEMARELRHLSGQVDGVLFDLGISSPQLDDPSRGFRPEADGPLDLRFDVSAGEPAWRVLERCSREELCELLARLGDGQDAASAARVADAVALAKAPGGPGAPRTTAALGALVQAARCGGDYQPMHAAKLTFQALRMHVNDEFGQLRAGLAAAVELLRPGGRIGIITWKHSECAVVMDFLRDRELAPEAFPLRQWLEARPGAKALKRETGLRRGAAKRPSEAELRINSRARSAVLHVLHKEAGVTVAAVEKAAHEALGWAPLPTQHA
jgi:16S rRNA (cytosine1402-N4)-methyltransferase